MRNTIIGMLLLSAATLGGCPRPDNTNDNGNGNTNTNTNTNSNSNANANNNTNQNGNGGTTRLSGSYSGTISCLDTQSLNGVAGNPASVNKSVTFTFGTDGVLSSLPIFGFTAPPDITTNVGSTGDSQVVTSGNSITPSIQYNITVRTATYTDTTADLTIDIDYTGSGGNLVDGGTAELILSLELTNGNLIVMYELAYDITRSSSGAGSFDAGETFNCEGVIQ